MGTRGNVLLSHLHLVIPMSHLCHYTNVCPHLTQKHSHTHFHKHTHTKPEAKVTYHNKTIRFSGADRLIDQSFLLHLIREHLHSHSHQIDKNSRANSSDSTSSPHLHTAIIEHINIIHITIQYIHRLFFCLFVVLFGHYVLSIHDKINEKHLLCFIKEEKPLWKDKRMNKIWQFYYFWGEFYLLKQNIIAWCTWNKKEIRSVRHRRKL